MPRRARALLLVGAASAIAVLVTGGPVLADPSPSPSPSTGAGVVVVPGLPATPLPTPTATPGRVVDTSPLALAQRQAAALQRTVDALEARTEQAVEHFNAVQDAYGQASRRHAEAQQVLTAAQAVAVAKNNTATDRIRALYMNGGAGGLAVIVVDGNNVTDVLSRYAGAQSVVADDTAQVVQATVAAEAAQVAEQALAQAAAEQHRLRDQAQAAASAVRSQLAATRRLLASASASVQAIVAAQLRAENEAAAKLAALLHGQQVANGGKAVAFGAKPDVLSPQIAAMLLDAEAQLGKPYQWGATGPNSYDCSGLVQHAYAAAGVALPRVAVDQYFAGTHPDTPDLLPGDLLFWATDTSDATTIHHVAIYLGGGYMLAAPHTGAFVSVQPVYADGYFGATRVIAPPPTPGSLMAAGG